jgi:hypothetical protein
VQNGKVGVLGNHEDEEDAETSPKQMSSQGRAAKAVFFTSDNASYAILS